MKLVTHPKVENLTKLSEVLTCDPGKHYFAKDYIGQVRWIWDSNFNPEKLLELIQKGFRKDVPVYEVGPGVYKTDQSTFE